MKEIARLVEEIHSYDLRGQILAAGDVVGSGRDAPMTHGTTANAFDR